MKFGIDMMATGGVVTAAKYGLSKVKDIVTDKSTLDATDTDQIKVAFEKIQNEVNLNDYRHDIANFRDNFEVLLKKTKIDKLVVYIDELDRCNPDTILETLEAIRLFVFVGKTYFIKHLDGQFYTNQRVATIKSNRTLNISYINYIVLSDIVQSVIKKNKNSTNDNISMDDIKSFIIPLPPLEEQQRIVIRIEELMLLVDEYEKKQVELEKLEKEFPEKLKKSILQYAIQGKLLEKNPNDESTKELLKKIKAEKEELITQGKIKKSKPLPPITDDEKPFDIPDSWEWVRLEEISANIHYGFNASASEDGNCRLLRITDIQNDKVNWDTVPFCTATEKEIKTYSLNNRDIMIARTGGTIGKTYITENLSQLSLFASYLIRVMPTLNVFEVYLKKYLESPFYWEQLKEKSAGTGQPNVNGTALKELVVPLPPFKEQQRIVARVEELFKLVDMISSGKRLKVEFVEPSSPVTPSVIEFQPKQEVNKRVDVASFDLVAREDGEITQVDLKVALSEVQDFYDKKKN